MTAPETRAAAAIVSRATVFAAVERGGRVKATVLPSRRGPRLHEQVVEWVRPDVHRLHRRVARLQPAWASTYSHHSRFDHSGSASTSGDSHTNTIEGFFGNLKTGIRGNYKKVSRKWLQGYLNEFTWRYNHRNDPRAMFEALLVRAGESRVSLSEPPGFQGQSNPFASRGFGPAPRKPRLGNKVG